MASLARAWAGAKLLTLASRRAALNLNVKQTRNMKLYRERTIRAMYWRGRSFDLVKYPERKQADFQNWNYRAEIFAFSRRIQENLSETTLVRVFAHPSYVDSIKKQQLKYDLPSIDIESNADLVTRGNQILDHCIKAYLRYTYSRLPEEGIASIADYLMSELVLADVAKWIGCKDIIMTAEWPPQPRTMADTVRALVAAIECDLDFDRAWRFIVDIIISYLNDKDILDDVWHIPNPRETLNLILANSQLPSYEPRLMFQVGVKTVEACHMIGLYSNQKLLGSSSGETLPIAEECAALDALQRLFDLRESRAPLVYGEAAERIDYKAHTREHDHIKTWRFEL